MPAKLVEMLTPTAGPYDHPYLQGAWQPTYNEWDASFAGGDALVIGTIPADIDGVYVRTCEKLARYRRCATACDPADAA